MKVVEEKTMPKAKKPKIKKVKKAADVTSPMKKPTEITSPANEGANGSSVKRLTEVALPVNKTPDPTLPVKKKRRRGRGRGMDPTGMDDEVFFRTQFGKRFITTYQNEHAFITSVFNRLPQSMLREDKGDDGLEDIFLLNDDNDDEDQGNKKEQEFLSRWLPSENGEKPSRTTDQNELRERLHAKISEIRQAKLDQVNPDKKKKKKKKRKLENGDGPDNSPMKKSKQAQFISKANPNAQSKKGGGGNTLGGTENGNGNASTSEKTPLRKKSVVKSDGQIVYSKFDFISEDKHHTKKGKSRPTDLLKSVEKHEDKIFRLESSGNKSAAVSVAESQRWISAIRRAQGYKVRDDPNLLKKTIRKKENIKKMSTKKWKERTDKIVKEREARQQKRKGNIQARKDDRKKKNQKLLKKRGRIA